MLFDGNTPLDIMIKKKNEELPRPSKYNPNLPTSIEQVLIKALAREPEYRYRTMQDFDSAEGINSNGPIKTGPSKYWLTRIFIVGILVLCCGADLSAHTKSFLTCLPQPQLQPEPQAPPPAQPTPHP